MQTSRKRITQKHSVLFISVKYPRNKLTSELRAKWNDKLKLSFQLLDKYSDEIRDKYLKCPYTTARYFRYIYSKIIRIQNVLHKLNTIKMEYTEIIKHEKLIYKYIRAHNNLLQFRIKQMPPPVFKFIKIISNLNDKKYISEIIAKRYIPKYTNITKILTAGVSYAGSDEDFQEDVQSALEGTYSYPEKAITICRTASKLCCSIVPSSLIGFIESIKFVITYDFIASILNNKQYMIEDELIKGYIYKKKTPFAYFKCPTLTCKKMHPISVLQGAIANSFHRGSKARKMVKQAKRIIFNKIIESIPEINRNEIIICKNPKCGKTYLQCQFGRRPKINPANRDYHCEKCDARHDLNFHESICPYCKYEFCIVCHMSPFHLGLPCIGHPYTAEDFATKDVILRLAESTPSNTRPCPTCGEIIIKISGCDKMKCYCGQYFCFRCNGKLDKDRPYVHTCPIDLPGIPDPNFGDHPLPAVNVVFAHDGPEAAHRLAEDMEIIEALQHADQDIVDEDEEIEN